MTLIHDGMTLICRAMTLFCHGMTLIRDGMTLIHHAMTLIRDGMTLILHTLTLICDGMTLIRHGMTLIYDGLRSIREEMTLICRQKSLILRKIWLRKVKNGYFEGYGGLPARKGSGFAAFWMARRLPIKACRQRRKAGGSQTADYCSAAMRSMTSLRRRNAGVHGGSKYP